MSLEINHVKGHQYGQGKELSREKKMNVIADELAVKALKEGNVGNTKGHTRNGPEFSIDEKIITSN